MKRVFPKSSCLFTLGIVLFCFTLLVSGCADLQEISALSATATATLQNTTYITDYASSFERQKELGNDKISEQMITNAKDHTTKMLAFYKGAALYTNILGKLSTDDIISYQTELKNLQTQVNTLGRDEKISDKQIDAVRLIAKIMTDNYRQKELKTMIENSDQPFGELIDTLIGFNDTYIVVLENELGTLKDRYELADNGDDSSIVKKMNILLTDNYLAKKNEVETKIKSVQAYNHSLEVIKNAHQELYKNRNDFSVEKLRYTLNRYNTELAQVYSELMAKK